MNFPFIDLFAGIGGMRMAFESVGGQCVFTSEWDEYARRTYAANFSTHEHPFAGDITTINEADIPDHDILLAGFPCQPFSIAGVSKHNALGNFHGFRHATQGTLFFDAARIIDAKRPKAFLLENVRNLVSHDAGTTFRTILETLTVELGYTVSWKIIDAASVVPQHRERVYIVGFLDRAAGERFEFPEFKLPRPALNSILMADVPEKYTLTEHLWDYLQKYAAKHRAKGNGFGYGLVNLEHPHSVTRTLSARYYKDGSEILIPQAGGRPRRLTPRECARLMGFPDSFKIIVSDTRAYKQFGNSVVVPVVTAIAGEILDCLDIRQGDPFLTQSRQWKMALKEPSLQYAAG